MIAHVDPFEFLKEALAHLDGRFFRVIGGQALGSLHLPRATVDIDLLVDSPALLSDSWPANPDRAIRRADSPLDPLDAVVEWWPDEGDPRVPVQVIVLNRPWLTELLQQPGGKIELGGVLLEAVSPVALVVLKVYAGGPRDRADVELIATHKDWPVWKAEIERRMAQFPRKIQKTWAKWNPGAQE